MIGNAFKIVLMVTMHNMKKCNAGLVYQAAKHVQNHHLDVKSVMNPISYNYKLKNALNNAKMAMQIDLQVDVNHVQKVQLTV